MFLLRNKLIVFQVLWCFMTTALTKEQFHINIVTWELQSGAGTSDSYDTWNSKLNHKMFSNNILITVAVNVYLSLFY